MGQRRCCHLRRSRSRRLVPRLQRQARYLCSRDVSGEVIQISPREKNHEKGAPRLVDVARRGNLNSEVQTCRRKRNPLPTNTKPTTTNSLRRFRKSSARETPIPTHP